MTTSLRIGAVNYLNTKPLIYQLEKHAPDWQLSLDVPSRLADQLSNGDLDIALIPVIEHFRAGNYSVIPNVSIASQGPVLSVTLFSRVPWEKIQSVALDEGSRTSVALTKVLLKHRSSHLIDFQLLPMDANPDQLETDAVLLIGDRAMRACLPGFEYAYDLGQEWYQWTGLPFVYAFWSVREGVDAVDAPEILQHVKREGRRHVGKIAQAESVALGLDAGFCRRYLETLIDFDLGEKELAGLQKFYDLASEQQLAPSGQALRFYEPVALL